MGSLDKHRTVHAPPNDDAAKPIEQIVEHIKAYRLVLQSYVKKRRELHDYHRQTEKTYNDPEVVARSSMLNSELHSRHIQLSEAGEKLGKGEHDVIVDILRQEGNLESSGFGLPEFSLLTTDDIFMGNAGEEHFVPRNGVIPARTRRDMHVTVGNDNDQRFFTKDDVLVVFEVTLYEGKGNFMDEWITYAPDSYAREQRARALAQQLGTSTRWFDDADPEYGFHAHSISLGGVVVKKKDLEHAAATIRDNPKLYRLGKEFYSEEEIKKNDEEYRKHLGSAYDVMGRYGNYEQNAQKFMRRIRQVYGAQAFTTAEKVYKEWVLKKRGRDG